MPILPQGLDQTKMENQWASMIEPVLNNPLNKANLLTNVSLAVGSNVINHKLGRQMQGWFLADIQGAAQIYRSAAMNPLTLTLHSDAIVVVNLAVF